MAQRASASASVSERGSGSIFVLSRKFDGLASIHSPDGRVYAELEDPDRAEGIAMRYIKLGNTGLDVSPIALGCMTYGEPGRGHPTWSLTEEESRPLIRQAVEAGINFFDTANMYSQGSSEEILGR